MIYLLLFLGILVFIIFRYIWNDSTVHNVPPGPKGIPLLGSALDVDRARLHQSLHELSKQYGPVVHLRLLRLRVVVLSSGRILKRAFCSDQYKAALNDKPKGFFGTHLVWDHQNVLLGPYNDMTFKLKDVMVRGMKLATQDGLNRSELKQLIDGLAISDGKDFDPSDLVKKTLADFTATLLCGEAQAGDAALLWEFVDWSNRLLNPSMESLMKRMPYLRHLPGKPGFLYKTVREKRDVLLARFLDEMKDTYTPGRCRGFVDACLSFQETEMGADGHPWITDNMIRALILDMIGGGLVTTTNTVLCCLLTLLNNSSTMDKMFAEIERVLGPTKLPSPEDEVRMPFCHSVILESLRYSSIVPLVAHYCSSNATDFEGYSIPKNTMVWGNLWASHHDESLWEQPWVFKPERFLNEQGEIIPKDDPHREFLCPFGLGARVCPGYDASRTRVFVYVVTVVQQFLLLPPEGSPLVSDDPRLYESGAVLQQQAFQCRALKRNTEPLGSPVHENGTAAHRRVHGTTKR